MRSEQNRAAQSISTNLFFFSNWIQLKPLNLVAGNATEVKGTYVMQEKPSLLYFLQEKSC